MLPQYWPFNCSWWHHQIEIFSALLAFCVGNSPVTGEFPSQRPVTRSFDVFFDMHLNKRLSKQSWGWWFETPSRSLIRHRNGFCTNMGLELGQCCAWWCQAISSQSVDYDVTIIVSGVVQQTINKHGTVDSGFNPLTPGRFQFNFR